MSPVDRNKVTEAIEAWQALSAYEREAALTELELRVGATQGRRALAALGRATAGPQAKVSTTGLKSHEGKRYKWECPRCDATGLEEMDQSHANAEAFDHNVAKHKGRII